VQLGRSFGSACGGRSAPRLVFLLSAGLSVEGDRCLHRAGVGLAAGEEREGECRLTAGRLLQVPCRELAVCSAGCLRATCTLEGAHRKPFASGRQLRVEDVHFSIFIVNMHRRTLPAFT